MQTNITKPVFIHLFTMKEYLLIESVITSVITVFYCESKKPMRKHCGVIIFTVGINKPMRKGNASLMITMGAS